MHNKPSSLKAPGVSHTQGKTTPLTFTCAGSIRAEQQGRQEEDALFPPCSSTCVYLVSSLHEVRQWQRYQQRVQREYEDGVLAFHTGMFCLCAVLYDLMLAGSRQTNITLAWTQPLIIKGIQGSKRSGCALDALVKLTQAEELRRRWVSWMQDWGYRRQRWGAGQTGLLTWQGLLTLSHTEWMLCACYGRSCPSCLTSGPVAVPRTEVCIQIKLKKSKFTEVNGSTAD